MKNILLTLLLLPLLVGCYTNAEWEREEYLLHDRNNTDFIIDGYRIGISFLPQNHSGFRNISYKGPYKVKIYSRGEPGKFTHLNILNVSAKLLQSKSLISVINSTVQVPFKLRKDINYYGSFHVIDQSLQPNFSSKENVVVTVELELINKEQSINRSAIIKFLLVPKHTKGITKIPWLTT